MTRDYRTTTEVIGAQKDIVRLYTRDMVRPKDMLLAILERDGDHTSAFIGFTEALQIVQGMVDYFEMTDYDIQLPAEDK